MLLAAGRVFRRLGFAGAGVDGLAKEAAVTSGAFYAHFGSKSKAFAEVVDVGTRDFSEAIVRFQRQQPMQWQQAFADFYLNELRVCEAGETCALTSLSADVSRADDSTKKIYEKHLKAAVKNYSVEGASDTQAFQDIAQLVGALTLSRAVKSKKLSEEIAAASLQYFTENR